MTDAVAVQEGRPLSQVERVVDTFVAPSKTFKDILRSTSWWLPLLILVVVTMGSSFAIDKKVGFEAVAEHQMTKSPSGAERMQAMDPEQRSHAIHVSAMVTRIFTYASFIPIMIIVSLEALVLWGSFNFGLGAKTTFGQVFAVILYAGLPRIFISLLTIIFLFAGGSTDNFDIQNPVGTNVGYFLGDSGAALKVAGSFLDVFGLWSLALLVIGMAIISRKSMGQAAAVVVGWWFICLLVLTGVAAAFG